MLPALPCSRGRALFFLKDIRVNTRSRSRTSWDSRLVFLLAGALLLLAPLLRGGNREVAVSGLLALGLAALAVVLSQLTHNLVARGAGLAAAGATGAGRASAAWRLAVTVVALSPLWIGALQLVPVPLDWWASLGGRQAYLDALRAAGVAVPDRLPLSLNPQATWAAMWAGVPAAAAFVLALRLPRTAVERLMAALLVAGLIQVVFAVAQFAGGPRSALYFGVGGQGFVGTFANRNHLADFLAMLLPVWVYVWLKGRHEEPRDGGQGRAFRAPGMLLLGFGFLVVLLSTQSRGGILSAAVVALLSALLCLYALRRHLKAWQQWGLGVALVLLLGLAALSVDLPGILSRVEQQRLQADAQLRQALAWATWDAARALWPWGSGMGSFESVFPRFQPRLPLGGYVNHAHNDYPQLVMELGAAGVLVAGVLLALVLRQLWALGGALRASGRLGSELALRCFAGLGCLALLLHSWVEFNMHIPALAITAAFLMGAFLRPLPRR